MKLRNLLFVLTFLNIGLTFSQKESRLTEIDKEISIALDNEDFELAAILKKEKELRLEIKIAVANSNFELAASNKEKLNDIEKYLSIDELITHAIAKEDYSKAKLLKSEKLELEKLINSDWAAVNTVSEEKINETPTTQNKEQVNTPKKAYVVAFSTTHFGFRGLGTPSYLAGEYSAHGTPFKSLDAGIILDAKAFVLGLNFNGGVILGTQLGMGYKIETNYVSPYITTTIGYDWIITSNSAQLGLATYINIGSEFVFAPLGRKGFGFYFETNIHLLRQFSRTPGFVNFTLGMVFRSNKTNKPKYSYLTK